MPRECVNGKTEVRRASFKNPKNEISSLCSPRSISNSRQAWISQNFPELNLSRHQALYSRAWYPHPPERLPGKSSLLFLRNPSLHFLHQHKSFSFCCSRPRICHHRHTDSRPESVHPALLHRRVDFSALQGRCPKSLPNYKEPPRCQTDRGSRPHTTTD